VNSNEGGTLLFASPARTDVRKKLSALVPKGAIEFQATRDLLLYGSVSRGARNGGINNVAVVASLPLAERAAALGYEDDHVTAYELGTKFYLFDRKVYGEAAAFYNGWSDYQVAIPAPLLNYIQSIGKAHTKGIEGSIRWRVTPELTLSGGGSLIEAELDQPTPSAAAGTRLTNVPDYNLNLAADADIPIGRVNLVGRVNFVSVGDGYQSFSNQVPNGNSFRPGYDLLNLNLGLRTARWSLIAYADNLTNTLALIQNVPSGTPGPLGERIVTKPRSYRLTFRFNF
jgi:outer membrane receptor protein involved in Fe transport